MPPSEPDFVGHFQRPQELLTEIDSVQAAKLVLSDAYYMQDKSDGHSRGVVKIGGTIFGLNKLGRRVPISQALFDELAQIPLATFQIDAELVGEKLVCRDLLHADGDLHALPYEKRFEKLVATILAAGTARCRVDRRDVDRCGEQGRSARSSTRLEARGRGVQTPQRIASRWPEWAA